MTKNVQLLLGIFIALMATALSSTAAQPPKVTTVSATTADGVYGSGASIDITVTFNAALTVVSGTPQLALNSGGTANYNGTLDNGAKTMHFTYVVGATDNSSDLDYSSTTALTLNGGTIANANGNATLTLAAPGAVGSLGNSKNIFIDNTGPTAAVADPTPSVTKAGPVDFVITYTDPNFSSSSALTTSAIHLVTQGTATGTISIDSGTGTNRTVTISSITGDGTIAISVDAGTAVDVVGNTASSAATSNPVSVGPSITASNAGEGTVLISISGSPDTTYQIQYTADLDNINWQNLGTALTDGSGVGIYFDNNVINSQTSRHYRIIIPLGI